MTPDHVNTLQWNQAIGYARQICARMFRDGGTPQDALRAFDLTVSNAKRDDWAKAVQSIAHKLCAQEARAAA